MLLRCWVQAALPFTLSFFLFRSLLFFPSTLPFSTISSKKTQSYSLAHLLSLSLTFSLMRISILTENGDIHTIEVDSQMELENIKALLEADVKSLRT